MDETEKVQNWISGVIGELNRLRRVQPAWFHQLQAQAISSLHPLWLHVQLRACTGIIQLSFQCSSESSSSIEESF